MGRQTIADLQAAERGALMRRGAGVTNLSTSTGSGLEAWAARVPGTPGRAMGVGVAAAFAGLALATVNPFGFLGVVVFGAMFSVGMALWILGRVKSRVLAAPPVSTVDARLAAERGRRVCVVLEQLGEATFEVVLARLRWTRPVLLETMADLRDAGRIVEDLNLDTGEWVYRLETGDDMGRLAPGSQADVSRRRSADEG